MNIIFILADDHRYDAMGFMNKIKGLQTPGLDRLAAEGAHLKNAFTSTALCSPSRASILTGQYAHTTTVVDNGGWSFVNLLKGRTTGWGCKEVFYEFYWEAAFPQTPATFAVRTNRYKYIYYNGVWDINESFGLQKDPYEMNNLIRDTTYRSIGLQLKDEMFSWLKQTSGLQIPLKPTINNRNDNLYRNTY